jgi:hypothetical protein
MVTSRIIWINRIREIVCFWIRLSFSLSQVFDNVFTIINIFDISLSSRVTKIG